MYKYVCFLFISLLMFGCSDNGKIVDKYKDAKQKDLVIKADTAFASEDFKKSAELYSAIANYYPGSDASKRAQLRAMYANAKLKNKDVVESLAQEFMHQYPRSKETSYAYYLYSIAPLFDHSSFLQRAFDAKPELRSTDLLKVSFKRLRALKRLYPKSTYIPQVKLILLNIKRLLSLHEADVAEYYYNKAAYEAAINRSMRSLEISLYKDSASKALTVMHNSFIKLKDKKEASKVEKVIRYNNL